MTAASGTAATLIVTLQAIGKVPSVTTYGKLIVPLKLASGVNVIAPDALILIVPLGTEILCGLPVSATPLILKIVGVVPSGSLSLNNKLSGTLLASSLMLAISELATGASGTGFIIIATLAGAETPPLLSIAIKAMLTVP